MVSSVIDGNTTDYDISQCFKDKYKSLYNSVPTSDSELDVIKSILSDRITKLSDICDVITPRDVMVAVIALNPGKGDGSKGLSSDHIINGTNRLFVLLSFLFQSIVVHGYAPNDMLNSVIVSIPKDPRSSLTTNENYRGISLCTCFCKIFHIIIINKCEQQLKSCDLQFAFKQDHSTIMCTSVLKQTVSLYLCKGSPVYSCLVDASKAFDKIHFGKLFNLLLKRNIPASIVRILLNMYESQIVSATWNGTNSTSFNVCNGVRQGGVLSPLLFAIYMDELIDRLKKTGVGCYVGYHFVGAVAYADDLTLLCPSREGLQSMLSVCESFGKEFHVTYNANKTACIIFDKKCHSNVPMLSLNNQYLEWKECVIHLGNTVYYNLQDNIDISNKKGKFISSVNLLMANFSSVPVSLLNSLFKSYCCSFYGSQIWNLRNKNINNMCTMYNKALRRIWHLPYVSHTQIVHELSNCVPLDVIFAKRFVNMFAKMEASTNICLKFLALSGKDNAMSFLGSNLMYIMKHYNVTSSVSFAYHISMKPRYSLNVQYLNDLVKCREHTMYIEGFDYHTINDMVDFWSTSDIVYI
jgi:hypothetical protein